MRVRRTLYLLAEDGVAFQAAANAIDVVESATGPGTIAKTKHQGAVGDAKRHHRTLPRVTFPNRIQQYALYG